jgi:hypothetical protein
VDTSTFAFWLGVVVALIAVALLLAAALRRPPGPPH